MKRRIPRPADLRPLLRLRRPTLNPLARAHTIDDLRRIARRSTPSGPFHYADGAADEEITARRVLQSFREIEFNPRVMSDVSEIDMRTELFGSPSALPFGLAPTGFTRMMHSAGETAVASAAAAAGIPYALSTVGTTSIPALAEAVPHGRKWFQLYPLRDRELTQRLLTAARDNDYEALVITVDVPAAGNRLRDLRYGMTIPPELTLKTFLDASYRPRWWIDFLTTEPYSFTFEGGTSGGLSDLVSALYDPSMTFDDLAWVREFWTGPLIVKGLQTVDDVERAVDFGADGVVLSSHGGRQLDRTPLPLDLLPRIAERYRGTVTIMLDSGIRSGGDIAAALGLGADFVLIGRPYLYGLMAGGEAGVARALAILRTELARTMALVGAPRISDLTADRVRKGP